MCVCLCAKKRGLNIRFTARKFEAVRETATREKLTTVHTSLVSKVQNSIHPTQLDPLVRCLLARKILAAVPLADRLKNSPISWKMSTKDSVILSVVITAPPAKPNQEKEKKYPCESNTENMVILEMVAKGGLEKNLKGLKRSGERLSEQRIPSRQTR